MSDVAVTVVSVYMVTALNFLFIVLGHGGLFCFVLTNFAHPWESCIAGVGCRVKALFYFLCQYFKAPFAVVMNTRLCYIRHARSKFARCFIFKYVGADKVAFGKRTEFLQLFA